MRPCSIAGKRKLWLFFCRSILRTGSLAATPCGWIGKRFKMLAKLATLAKPMKGRSEVKALNKPCPLNSHLLCRTAWKWLKVANEYPHPYQLHLLTLAMWGLETGVAGDLAWPSKARSGDADRAPSWVGPNEIMDWMFSNPNGPCDRAEQEESLLTSLESAGSPHGAAANVLNVVWARQESLVP